MTARKKPVRTTVVTAERKIPAETLRFTPAVKNSVDNTTVDASTGYFVEIPETTEDGDIALNIEDVINGINNAV